MTITTETVCGKEPCCLNPAQCDEEARMEESANKARTDLEKLTECMAGTSQVIEEFRAKTVEAVADLANGVEAMKDDIQSMPEAMQKTWLTYYISAMQEVASDYAKVLGQ